jgi:Spy/CpxP family protein refolding chaperone
LAVTFLAGGFSGAAIDRWGRTPQASPEPQASAQAPSQENERSRPHGSIFDLLDLSTVQRATIDSILQEGRDKVEAWRKETEPEYRTLVNQTRAEVRAVLTPEQVAEYDRLRAEHRAAKARNASGNGATAEARHGNRADSTKAEPEG